VSETDARNEYICFVRTRKLLTIIVYTVSKNDTALACYNFDVHQPVLLIFWHTCCYESEQSSGTIFCHLA